MHRRTHITIGICTLFVLLARAPAAEPLPIAWPAAPRMPSGDAAAQYVADLGSDDFTHREQASTHLLQLGLPAIPAIRAGTDSPDPEISARCTALLEPKTLLAPPWLPRQYAAALEENWSDLHPMRVISMRVSPYDERTNTFLDFVFTLDASPEGKDTALSWQDRRIMVRARDLAASGNLLAAKQLLAGYLPRLLNGPLDSDPQRDYVALTAFIAGKNYNPDHALAELDPLHLGFSEKGIMEFELRRAALDYQGASRNLWNTGQWTVAIEARDYATIARVRDQQPEAIVALKLLGKFGDATTRENLLAQVATALPDRYPDAPRQLILMDRIDSALQTLRAAGQNEKLASVFCQRLELREALACHIEGSEFALPEQFSRLGLPATAHRLFEQSIAFLSNNGATGITRLRFATALAHNDLPEWAADQARIGIEWILRTTAVKMVKDPQQSLWISTFADQKASPQIRWQRLQNVINGNLSNEEAAAIATDFAQQPVNSALVAAETLHLLGHDDPAAQLAIACWQHENDPAPLSVLGDIALDHGSPAAAFNCYQQAALFRRTDPTLMYRAGLALSRIRGMRAAGDQLKSFAPALVLGQRDAALKLAATIAHYEGPAAGIAWFDNWTARFCREFPADMAERFARSRDSAEAGGNLAEALNIQNQIRVALAQSAAGNEEQAMQIMANYHRLRALDALNRKDWSTLQAALLSEMNYGPVDALTLSKAIPALKITNAPAAREILAQARTRLETLLKEEESPRYRDMLTTIRSLNS